MRRIGRPQMYASLQLPWSDLPSHRESAYRAAGLVKTKGTIYLLPPSNATLQVAFDAPPRSVSRMSAGAVALCKHFERGGASSELGRPHPFWILPLGSNEKKNNIARSTLEAMLNDAAWRNVMILHPNVAVYEMRNSLGYGMRWTLDIQGAGEGGADTVSNEVTDTVEKEASRRDEVANYADKDWRIGRTVFRGFLEPITGLDHELPLQNVEQGAS